MKDSLLNIVNIENAVVERIQLPGADSEINIFIKREDLIHPAISGNKWYKLKYNLIKAKEENRGTLVTFGGAYSNHIYATASAGKAAGFNTVGIIRGEEHLPLNPTLKFAAENGMKLIYVSRAEYRRRYDPDYSDYLRDRFADSFIVPEGGTNPLAVKGASEIINNINIDFDYVCTACGTGGTLAGLVAGLNGKKQAFGFAVLKGAGFLNHNVKNLHLSFPGREYSNWQINLDYHFGGYAKITRELIEFMYEFEKLNGIKLDPVYTGKMMFGITDLVKKKFFKSGQTILAVHTGGLQGIEGMRPKIEKLFPEKQIIRD